jgi:hypothetical protein
VENRVSEVAKKSVPARTVTLKVTAFAGFSHGMGFDAFMENRSHRAIIRPSFLRRVFEFKEVETQKKRPHTESHIPHGS